MKKIFNWTVGSFFKTLGRIISYLFIGGVLFYIASKYDLLSFAKLDASTFSFTYDYDQDMLDKLPSKWFGSNGWLSRITNLLDSQRDSIWISQDTIYVAYGVSSSMTTNQIRLYVTYDDVNFNYSLKLTASKIYAISNETELNNFIKNYSNNKSSLDYQTSIELSCDTSESIVGSDFSGPKCDKFLLPFYRNDVTYFIYNDTSFNTLNFFGIPIIGSASFGFTDTMNIFLYNKYGFDKPDINKLKYVYNNAIILDTDNLNNATSTFSINLLDNKEPIIKSIQYYGLVNDNGLYHYELLDNITDFDYTTTFTNKKFTFSFNTNAFTYTDISTYEKIYVKINYQEPFKHTNNGFTYTLGTQYTYQIILNTLCDDCVFLSLDSSGKNTYVFSNSDSSKNTLFYYSNIQENKIVYNQPSFIDLANKTLINSDLTIKTYDTFYGSINQLMFDYYNIGSNTGLIMNLYMNDMSNMYNLSGAYQIIYFISPNLYWGNGVYTTDRNQVSYDYIDSDGNHQTGTIAGDFTNSLSDYDISAKFNIIKGIMSDDFYGLSGVILKPLDHIKTLSTKVCSPIILPIPFTEKNVTIPCFSTIYDTYVKDLIDIWHIVLYGIVSYGIGLNLFKTIKNAIDPTDEDNIEVIDL